PSGIKTEPARRYGWALRLIPVSGERATIMLIGLLADTHNQRSRTATAVKMLKAAGASTLFHCGDLTDPAIVTECSVLPCYYVFGNNDDYDIPGIRNEIAQVEGAISLDWGGEVELAGKRLAMTHGHLRDDVRRLLDAQPDYLFSGHSHISADW